MGFGAALEKAGIKNAENQGVSRWLSTGYPVLDHRLSGRYHGGGFASGRIIEVFGPPSAGKTAIATEAMICAQKAGGLAGFHDHERSFASVQGERLGLSLNPDNWVYQAPNTFEASIDLMKETILTARGMRVEKGDFVTNPEAAFFDPKAPFCWVFDSLASMVPQSALYDAKGNERDATDRNMNDNTALARATAQHFPALAVFAEATDTCIIFLNQIRTKIGERTMPGRPPPTSSPGGNAPEFYTSQRLELGKSFITDEKQGYKKIGQTVRCEVVKNKTWRPWEKCSWDFMFMPDGSGRFDVIGGVIDELKTLGILETSGAYISWEGKKYYKSQLISHIEETGDIDKLIGMLP